MQNEILPGLIEATSVHEFVSNIERYKQTVYYKNDPSEPYPEKAFIYPKEPLAPGLYIQKVILNKKNQAGTLDHIVEYSPTKG